MNRCIHRDLNDMGKLCKLQTPNQYCILHKESKNPICKILHDMLKNNPEKLINTNDIIYIYCKLKESKINNVNNLILKFIGKKKNILQIANDFIIKNIKKTIILKEKIIEKFEWIFLISNLLSFKNKVINIQKQWKQYIKNISGENLGIPNNDEELFTLKPISEIEYPFYIEDSKHVYVFEAKNLCNFIHICGKWNPYTRSILNDETIMRLAKFMTLKNIELDKFIRDGTPNWNTITQAYTDVAIKLESIGFLVNIEWFIDLSFDDIINILSQFARMTFVLELNNYNLDIDISNVNPQYVYDFCKIILQLFDHDDVFTLVCLMLKCFAMVSNIFKENLPYWIHDIRINIDIENIFFASTFYLLER